MKKSIFLFFAAILCATNAWAGPTFKGGCVYFHNKGGWNDSYKYICISHDSWTEPRSVTVITNTQLWYNALPTSGWTDAKYMSAMGHSSSKSASNFKVSSCNHYTKNVSLGDWGFNSGNAQMLTPANGNNNAALELTYMGNSYSSMNRTITVKAKVSTDNGSSFAEATSPGTLSASSFAFTSYTSCKSAKTLSSGKITCGYTANTSLTAADADGYIFAGWYDASGNKQTEELTLSLNPTADATYYAYYTRKALAEETHDVTVSYMCGATSIKAFTTASGVGVSTASEITAPVIAGYNFSNWTLGSGVQSADANANPISITTKASGDYTLTANYTEIPKATIYFVNNSGWSKIQAYAWEGTKGANPGWPGADITANKLAEKIGEYDVYSYTVEQGSYGKVIFNNGSAQTANYVWTDGNYYWHNEAANFAGGTKAQAEEKFSVPVEYDYVYLINTNDWAKAYIYTWESEVHSWPGAEMTKEAAKIAGKDVYSYKVVKGTTFGGLNFNCGGDECKTGNLTWQAGKYYAPSKDKWYDDAAAAEAGLAVNTYTVVGSSAPLFGEAWATAKTENDMTLVEGTKYELVKSDIALTAGDILYKVAVDHAWTESYPTDNLTLNIPEAGKYTVTFTFDSNTKAVNATAELTEAAVVLPTVGVKGAWDSWAATTTLTGDNTSASATVNIATAGIYEFGLDVDGNFQASGATIDKANNSTVVTTNAGNMKLTANVLGDYTFTWTYETNTLTVTYPAGEEIDLNKYYVIGLSGNWDIVPANELVPVSVGSKEYSLVANMTAGTHEFKVSDATKANTYGYAQLTKKNYNELSEGEYSNIKLTLATNAEVTITFNGETKAITLTSTALTENTTALTYTVTVPAGTAKCYICGAWDWNTFKEMTPTANANEFTIDIVGATTGQEYKYTRGEGWEYAEVNADGSTRANRTYNANDVVDRWADVITYVLMGVNGDWTTGIPMIKDGEQYVCKDVTIDGGDDAVKAVTLTNGVATAWCGNVDSWSNAVYTADTDGNIVLEDGIYDFYFKVSDDNIYINQTGYVRNVTNTYGTICLPYASASTTGATFYRVAGKETGKVYLESVNALEAGVPYIFEKSASQIKVVYTGEKETTPGPANGLVGTFTNETEVAAGNYILLNNELRLSDGSAKVNANRAYLKLDAVTGGQPAQMPGRRYIGMSVQGENEATGFENITAPEGQAIKVIENGQLIIIRGNEKFNAQGVRL